MIDTLQSLLASRKAGTQEETPASQKNTRSCYRRLIDLRAQDETAVVGWLEDDFHHFGVVIVHDGIKGKTVRAISPSYSRTTCSGALEAIRALEGKPLVKRCSDIEG